MGFSRMNAISHWHTLRFVSCRYTTSVRAALCRQGGQRIHRWHQEESRGTTEAGSSSTVFVHSTDNPSPSMLGCKQPCAGSRGRAFTGKQRHQSRCCSA